MIRPKWRDLAKDLVKFKECLIEEIDLINKIEQNTLTFSEFLAATSDGVIFCKILNTCKPGSFDMTQVKNGKTKEDSIWNLNLFINGCKNNDIEQIEQIDTEILMENKNIETIRLVLKILMEKEEKEIEKKKLIHISNMPK